MLDAVRLAYCQPYVEAFFNFHLCDEVGLAGWQSVPFWYDRTRKDSYDAFSQAFAEVNAGTVDCSRLKGGPPPRPDTTPPAAPANLSAVGSVGNPLKVTLDWDDGAESDLETYGVYRSTAPGGPYQLVGSTARGTSTYTDTSVSNGTTYYYAVAARDTADNESAYSAEAAATPRAPVVAEYRPLAHRRSAPAASMPVAVKSPACTKTTPAESRSRARDREACTSPSSPPRPRCSSRRRSCGG